MPKSGPRPFGACNLRAKSGKLSDPDLFLHQAIFQPQLGTLFA
jgi:hypothetical protein